MAREMQVINTEQGQVKLIHEDDIVEGHLWCEHCKYNNNCEEILENCVNVIFNGKVCHPKSAELFKEAMKGD